MKLTLATITLSLFGFAFSASAQSLEEKKKRADAEKQVQESLDYMNEKCGTKVTMTIDWDSFKGDAIKRADECRHLPSAISSALCYNGEQVELDAVKQGVKKLTCKWNNASSDQKLVVKGGNVTYTRGEGSYNIDDFIKEQLAKQL